MEQVGGDPEPLMEPEPSGEVVLHPETEERTWFLRSPRPGTPLLPQRSGAAGRRTTPRRVSACGSTSTCQHGPQHRALDVDRSGQERRAGVDGASRIGEAVERPQPGRQPRVDLGQLGASPPWSPCRSWLPVIRPCA